MNELQISASVLSADFLHLAQDLTKVSQAGADLWHMDIMDGHFVPNLSFGTPVLKAAAALGIRPLDVHFMVTNPQDYLPLCAELGVQTVTVHQEVCPHLHRVLGSIRDLGMKAGVALNPSTSPNTLSYVKDMLDFVLIMSVNPGFSGQKFIHGSLDKIDVVRQMLGPEPRIGVDGGVTPENSRLCVEKGADVLIAATAIFGQKDYKQAISDLRVGRR